MVFPELQFSVLITLSSSTMVMKISPEIAHTLAREAYFSKYLIPFDTWLSRTLRDAIRESFAKMSAIVPGHKRRGFGFYLLRQIGKATADLQLSLKNREYLYDAKRPAILEYHLGIGDFADVDKLTSMAVAILGDAYAVLSQSDLIADVSGLSFVDLRTDDVFISFGGKGFPVWLVPGLIYFREGAASAINAEVRLTEQEDSSDFFARIGRQNSPGSAARTRSSRSTAANATPDSPSTPPRSRSPRDSPASSTTSSSRTSSR